MRMPQAKSGYQRAELSKSQPFPPPCSVTLRGCLGCWSLTRDSGVLAPAQLPSPSASAGGDIPELSPPGPGILGWETHPAIMSCLGTPHFWWPGCTQDGMDAWTAGSSLHQPLARAAWSAETHGASCPPRCLLPPTLLTHAGASMGAHISWHRWGHILKPMAAGTQGQGLALQGLS